MATATDRANSPELKAAKTASAARATRSRRFQYAVKLLVLAAPEAIDAAANNPGPGTGVESSAIYTADLLANTRGGVDTGFRFLDNLELGVYYGGLIANDRFEDRAELVFLYNNRTTAGELVGDLQGVSNIDAEGGARVFQAWYEIAVSDWSIRTGLYDLNSEFDSSEAGSFFVNSSHGIGADLAQTGENGPGIFPVSGLALRLMWHTESLRTRVVVMDGVPGDPSNPRSNEVRLDSDEGALVVAEIDREFERGRRLWFGAWHYTSRFDSPFELGTRGTNSGWYLGFESRFRLAGRDVGAFVRFGEANEDLNAIANYLGTGIVVEAPFASRPNDHLGLAMASAGVGEPYRQQLEMAGEQARHRETIWELSYRAALSDRLALQPDLQWIVSPAASGSINNALVFTLRFEWTLWQ